MYLLRVVDFSEEVLKCLEACRTRMANVDKVTSNPERRQAIIALEMAHELALLALLGRVFVQPESGPSHWERIRKPEL